ncbi:MAG: 50S ribosomal protein L23 [Patescibacteria group bacterium]|jgi:large subunit ribosomal protein L23
MTALFGKKEEDGAKAKKTVSKTAGVKAGEKATQTEKKSMKELYSGTGAKPAAAKKTKGALTAGTGEKKVYGRAYRVLIKPLVTEKASVLSSLNKYNFSVSPDANRIEVAKAIHEVYGIKPVKVNIINNKGKKVRYGKTKGTRKDWKKAVVTLPAGKSINVYEGV